MVVTLAARAGEWRPGPAWPSERARRGYIVGELVVAIVMAVNIALASVGYLQLSLLFLLFVPVGTFARSVRDVTQGTDADAGSDESPRHRPSPARDASGPAVAE